MPIVFRNAEALVAERSAVIYLADHIRIEGMARITTAPPRAATGMCQGGTLSRGDLTTAEFKNITVYIV